MKRLLITVLAVVMLTTPIQARAEEIVKIPSDVRLCCDYWGHEYGICSELLQALCWHETRCRAELDNGDCKGMCQINARLQKERMKELGITDIHSTSQNIHLCADMLYELFEEEEDLYSVLMKYNCGSGRGAELFEQGIYTQYAIEVSELAERLERLHGK